MATVKYTGARYLLKFVDAWEADTAYEPLVALRYNDASYISKQPVPASVGAPDENIEYWAYWGSGDVAFEELRNLVLQFSRQVEQNTDDIEQIQNELENEICFEVLTDGYDTLINSYVTILKLDKDKYSLTDFIPFSVTNAPNSFTENYLSDYENVIFCAPNLPQDYFIRNGEYKMGYSDPWTLLCFDANNNISSIDNYDSSISASDLISQGITNAMWVWEPLILNGINYNIDNIPDERSSKQKVVYERNPRFIIGWDNTYIYLIAISGRQPFNEGTTHAESLQLVTKYNIPNAVNCDGGGSVQLWLTPNPINLVLSRESDNRYPLQSRPKPLSGFGITQRG